MAAEAAGASTALAAAEGLKEGAARVDSNPEVGAVVETVVEELAEAAAAGAGDGGCTESSGAGLEEGILFRAVTLSADLLGRGPVFGGMFFWGGYWLFRFGRFAFTENI